MRAQGLKKADFHFFVFPDRGLRWLQNIGLLLPRTTENRREYGQQRFQPQRRPTKPRPLSTNSHPNRSDLHHELSVLEKQYGAQPKRAVLLWNEGEVGAS